MKREKEKEERNRRGEWRKKEGRGKREDWATGNRACNNSGLNKVVVSLAYNSR